MAAFLNFLNWQAWGEATNLDDLDVQVSGYIEYLWDTGWGTHNMAGFVISGAGHFLNKRRILFRSWDLWKEWGKREKQHTRPRYHCKPGQRWRDGLRCSITPSGRCYCCLGILNFYVPQKCAP